MGANLSDKDEKPGFWETTGGFLVIALLIVLIMAANVGLMAYVTKEPTQRGVYGDMFGGVTALFSGLAFAGLIVTLVIQRKELRFQRLELEASNREFALQRFDSAFFGMIKMLNDHIASVSFKKYVKLTHEVNNPTGREALSHMAVKLMDDYDTTRRAAEQAYDAVMGTDTFDKYGKIKIEEIFRKDDDMLGPYFRILYNIFRRISQDTVLEDHQRMDYARIARSHLSLGELNLIYFNGVTDNGLKFKTLIERYAVLKHTSFETRGNFREIEKRYRQSAFGGNALVSSVVAKQMAISELSQ